MKALPIQAVSQAFQAATASPVVSASMEATASGGLLQSLVPTHGGVNWTSASTMSSDGAQSEATAFLLVASLIIQMNVVF